MGDEAGEVSVDVAVEPQDSEAPETVVDAAPVVIVEDSGNEAGTVTEAEAERRVEEAREQTALEIAVAGLIETQDAILSRLTALEVTDELQGEALGGVIEEQGEMSAALTEEVQESVGEGEDIDGDGEPDEAPTTARRHWLFRSRDEWRGR